MELSVEAVQIPKYVTAEGTVIHIYLGYNNVAIQKQLIIITSLIKDISEKYICN